MYLQTFLTFLSSVWKAGFLVITFISLCQVANNGALAQKGFWNMAWPHILPLDPVIVLGLWIKVMLDTMPFV